MARLPTLSVRPASGTRLLLISRYGQHYLTELRRRIVGKRFFRPRDIDISIRVLGTPSYADAQYDSSMPRPYWVGLTLMQSRS
jgi:hypothetical protein